MKHFIPPFPVQLLFMFIIAVAVSLQMIGYAAVRNQSEAARDVSCAVKSVDVNSADAAVLKLDCAGTETKSEQAGVVASFLQNPGPLTCTVYRSGRAGCKLPKQ